VRYNIIINDRLKLTTTGISMAQLRAVQNNIDGVVQAAKEEAWNSEAWAMTAKSFADEPVDTHTRIYTSNKDGTFSFTETTHFSAFHWQEKAKLAGTGLVYQGVWDASTGIYPPNGTNTGDFYVVSVNGDIGGTQYRVGDWVIWDNENPSWNLVGWNYDWSTITNVPENVSNALSRSGGDLTGIVNAPAPVYDQSDSQIPTTNWVMTQLNAKVDNERVLTDVPENALFTDTLYNDVPVYEAIDAVQTELDTTQEAVDLNTDKVGITTEQTAKLAIAVPSDITEANTLPILNMVRLSQQHYNDLAEHAPDTFYVIIEVV